MKERRKDWRNAGLRKVVIAQWQIERKKKKRGMRAILGMNNERWQPEERIDGRP